VPTTKPVASRIDVESKEQIEAAAAELGITPSEYLKKVIEDHIDQNPYDMGALSTDPNESSNDFIEEMLNGLE
jgi:antitoxin component of RelBE/YafQ-DinJ toxin-antitoxin module